MRPCARATCRRRPRASPRIRASRRSSVCGDLPLPNSVLRGQAVPYSCWPADPTFGVTSERASSGPRCGCLVSMRGQRALHLRLRPCVGAVPWAARARAATPRARASRAWGVARSRAALSVRSASGVAIETFADRVAAAIGDRPRDSSPAEVAEGVRLLSESERRRIVRSWAGWYPDRWRKICAEVGDTGLAETTLVASAVRAAVADRIACPREVVAKLEGGASVRPSRLSRSLSRRRPSGRTRRSAPRVTSS
jgi:hypothetical protein